MTGNVLETLIEELKETNRLLKVIASRLEMGTVGNSGTQESGLYSVNHFIEKYPSFTKGGLRTNLFNSSFNGLDQSGAIKRVGRKILIDEVKFLSWVETNPKTFIKPKRKLA